MEVLSVISRLIDYPDADILEHEQAMLDIIDASDLNEHLKEKLEAFIETNLQKDLMDWQAEYSGQFERGRSLGLWLFEHVHGESRDRGQAMVDLMALYQEQGFEISVRELPDYIPLYLEFLAQRPDVFGKIADYRKHLLDAITSGQPQKAWGASHRHLAFIEEVLLNQTEEQSRMERSMRRMQRI